MACENHGSKRNGKKRNSPSPWEKNFVHSWGTLRVCTVFVVSPNRTLTTVEIQSSQSKSKTNPRKKNIPPNNQIYHRIKHPKLSEKKKSRSWASAHRPGDRRSATSIGDEAYPFGDSAARFHLLCDGRQAPRGRAWGQA
jgi:hypothetical protein